MKCQVIYFNSERASHEMEVSILMIPYDEDVWLPPELLENRRLYKGRYPNGRIDI